MKNIKNIVISGGNTSVFAFFGFFKYLSENNLLNNVEAYTGTSAGAVTGLLFSIGYKWNEMYQFNRIFNYSKLYDFSLTSFINNYAFCNMDKFSHFIIKAFEYKKLNPKMTFKEHFEITKIKVTFTGSCLNDGGCEFFNYINYPDMEILQAVKISCCIPFIFPPIIFNNKLWVDGGLFLNYPIEYHDNELDETIGMAFKDSCIEKCHVDVTNLPSYMSTVFKCILNGDIKKLLSKYESNTLTFTHEQGVLSQLEVTPEYVDEIVSKCYEQAKIQYVKIEKFIDVNKTKNIIDEVHTENSNEIEDLAKNIESETEGIIQNIDSETEGIIQNIGSETEGKVEVNKDSGNNNIFCKKINTNNKSDEEYGIFIDIDT